MEGLNMSSSSYPFYSMVYADGESFEFGNITRVFTAEYMDSNKRAFFLIGMAFLGGLGAGFILQFFYSCLMRYLLGSDLDDDESLEGHVNLSFIGDDFRLPNDSPPDYATVMAGSSADSGLASNSQGNWNFFKRFSFRNAKKFEESPEEELPPPSYSSVLASLESDLSNR